MKLRNKKTGEICELVGFNISNDSFERKFGEKDYYSLQDFCDDWEDYTPKEPLIKDEKIRSIVRAWIRANHIVGKIESYGGTTWLGLRGYSDTEGSWKIELRGHSEILFGDYTIAELCGEEE